MTDGAHLGILPEAAMKAVLGGDKPTERYSTAELAEHIEVTTLEDARNSYDGCALYAAKLLLQYVRTTGMQPTEAAYEAMRPLVSNAERRDVLDQLTGFMWGWAMNAVRAIVELPPVSNPAIVTIAMKEE